MKTTMMGGLVMAVVLGFAPGTPAKTLQGMIANSNQPNGTVFTSCNGSLIFALASGYDSSGNTVCSLRAASNNTWLTTTSCPASAVKQGVQLRAAGTSFCSSNQIAWGTGHVCFVSNMLLKPNGGACVSHPTVYAFSSSSP